MALASCVVPLSGVALTHPDWHSDQVKFIADCTGSKCETCLPSVLQQDVKGHGKSLIARGFVALSCYFRATTRLPGLSQRNMGLLVGLYCVRSAENQAPVSKWNLNAVRTYLYWETERNFGYSERWWHDFVPSNEPESCHLCSVYPKVLNTSTPSLKS